MDDGPVTTVLPKELRLGAPPSMPQARSYLFRQQSTLSTYDPEQQIQINVPRLQRSYLRKDSYLQFRLNGQYQPNLTSNNSNTSTNTGSRQYYPDLALDDAGAWGLFERIEIFDYLGSTVLETIDGLPQLMSLLLDMGPEFTDPDHAGQITSGLQQQYTATLQRDANIRQTITSTGDITFPLNLPATTLSFKVGTTAYTATIAADAAVADVIELVNNVNLGLAQTNSNVMATYSGTGKLQLVLPYGGGVTSTTLSLTTADATLKLAAGNAVAATNSNIVSQAGIGLPFYQGGMPVVTTGFITTSSTKEFSYQFSIALPSFLGFLSKKLVPLHNGFTIVLTLASKYKPFFIAPKQCPLITFAPSTTTTTTAIGTSSTTAAAVNIENTIEPQVGRSFNPNQAKTFLDPTTFWWQLSDVSLVCNILELGPIAESMILSTSQGQPLILHTKQMRYYRGNVTQAQSEFHLPLNLNVSSLTNILWFMRPSEVEDNLRYQSYAGRVKNYLQRWEFQYGSTVLPQSNGIQSMYMANPTTNTGGSFTGDFTNNGFTECITELLKARPTKPEKGRLSMYNLNNNAYPGIGAWSILACTPWKTIDPTGEASAALPKFACGLNLELAPGKVGDLISGLNTNGMNTSIRGYFHPSNLSSSSKFDSIIDSYAEYDAFINISPGIATTVSF